MSEDLNKNNETCSLIVFSKKKRKKKQETRDSNKRENLVSSGLSSGEEENTTKRNGKVKRELTLCGFFDCKWKQLKNWKRFPDLQ